MAYNQEEWEQRQYRRRQEKERRMAAQKGLKIKLLLAGFAILAVLAACFVLAMILRQESEMQGTEPTGESATVDTTGETTLSTEPADPETVITFAAAGDVNVTDKVIASGGVMLDFNPIFQDVVSLLADADLTVVNFEGNMVGAPYGSEKSSAPPQLLTALKNAGVDMVQFANSRTISNGMTGLVTSLQSIRATGLEPLGVYANSSEFEKSGGYTIWETKGVKLAIVAFTKGMDSMALPVGSEKCVNLLYEDYSSKYVKIDKDRITSVIQAAAAEKPDVIITLLHWGSEYNDTHAESQGEIVELLFGLGVDAIIGTHPHYVQEMQYDAQKGTFLAYSIGDLLGDGEKSGTEYSVVLELEITKNNRTGETKITNYQYTPIFIYENPEGLMRVVRLKSAMDAYEQNFPSRVSDEIYSDMVYAATRVEERINPKKDEDKQK